MELFTARVPPGSDALVPLQTSKCPLDINILILPQFPPLTSGSLGLGWQSSREKLRKK